MPVPRFACWPTRVPRAVTLRYLARPDLTALHAERVGHVEGFDRADILKYLRHEMGHVINYAYRLYDQEEWVTSQKYNEVEWVSLIELWRQYNVRSVGCLFSAPAYGSHSSTDVLM